MLLYHFFFFSEKYLPFTNKAHLTEKRIIFVKTTYRIDDANVSTFVFSITIGYGCYGQLIV